MKIKFKNSIPLDDSTLWSKLKAGDEKAFSLLFEKYYEQLLRYGNSFSSDTEKVQDCIQDVFADVWLYKNTLNENAIVKAYLLSSVRNRLARIQERDHIFRKTTSTDSLDFLFDFSIEHQLIIDESTADKVNLLNKNINLLPSRQKEALYLRYHQGLSVEQIADLLDVNYQSANNLLHRALLHLRKEWNSCIPLLLLLSPSVL
ncbi:RNA polymerase sigma factor [Flavobacterium muglaense]|uniref:Sigma-70 family RNA polymerase sigma factor n=1 Tax=Flavobacterium muglaense TaxID=2764716 RepID=A0A923SEY4_9FLAO|nr:sigma-70 family RNA polymerase sigma factor [Flavobacterium muglaense]MBC5836570.1 sigma-70 family RNA polymerase sigma factor [Flavobacterium muglaense]MBC5843164.1 sigma-70 family RNA polymerase sigma factor [Flavobacterium muglaense]